MTEPARSPPTSPLDKPSGVRFNDRGVPVRPAMSRTFSQLELSTIDQKWGRLFENDGTPTKRLGEFLRGLANHIVSITTTSKFNWSRVRLNISPSNFMDGHALIVCLDMKY